MNLKNKTLRLKEVTGKGVINLEAIGLGKIFEVFKDGEKYEEFNESSIKTIEGTHSYEIRWR